MNIGELISGVKAGYCACENKDGPKLEVHCTTHHPQRWTWYFQKLTLRLDLTLTRGLVAMIQLIKYTKHGTPSLT